MALDPATKILTDLAIILLLGLIVTLFSKKLKISNILLLMLTGITLGKVIPQTSGSFQFSSDFLVAVAVLTLVMVVFDGSSRFKLKMVNLFSVGAIKVTSLFLLCNLIFISFFTMLLFFQPFTVESVLLSVLFAFVMSGTDPGSVFIMLKSKTNKVIEFLEVEAIINTPIMVIFPFIILDILNNLQTADVARAVVNQALPLLQQIVVGIGAGMVIGIIVLKTMKRFYSQQFSPVALITSALLAYILAENLAGNGVLAVATLGLFFGNIYVKEKENLQEFNTMLNSSLIIIVFILIGLIIEVDFSLGLLVKSLLLFGILILTRLLSLALVFRKQHEQKQEQYRFNTKELLFMACSMPKGIAAAVVAFSLSVFTIAPGLAPMMHTVLQLIVVMMVYSLIFSSVVDRFSKKLIRIKIEEGE
ncbi:cation:proton antiporter [Candidatus Woesearchaeota archaeon]|nr:cation:proton antiporter [Candidatus Woesearchaeota archaeon]